MEYLGHIIIRERVTTNPEKVAVMRRWLTPTTLKELRGFLGLTRYYRRFIKGYRTISKLLTELLKKDNFHWNEEAQESFEKLKEVMITTPILAMPNYTLPFTLEIDASGHGIGAMLSNKEDP